MKKLLFLLLTITTNAQIKGVVTDSLTKQPIAYAAVLVQNTKTGVNTEVDGSFNIDYNGSEKKLLITALGYNNKTIDFTATNQIILSPKINEIKAVVVQNRLGTSEIVVGEYKRTNFGHCNSGFKSMWAKKIESTTEIEKHPYIKNIEFVTHSDVKNATIKLHFLEINDQGKAGDDIVQKDIVITVKKGKRKNFVDISSYKIKIPSEGIFIAFENLIIEANKYEYNATTEGIKGNQKHVSYEPSIYGSKSIKNNVWSITDVNCSNSPFRYDKNDKNIELAIKLTLTN